MFKISHHFTISKGEDVIDFSAHFFMKRTWPPQLPKRTYCQLGCVCLLGCLMGNMEKTYFGSKKP